MTPERFLNGGSLQGIAPQDFLGGGGFEIESKQTAGSTFKKNVKQAVTSGLDSIENIRKQGEAGQISPISEFVQTGGAAAKTVGDFVFETIRFFTPKKLEELASKGAQKIAQNPTVQSLATRYQDLKTKFPEATANAEALFNIGSLLPVGAGGSVAAKTTAQTAIKAADAAAPIAKTMATKSVQLPARGVSEIQGALTGTSGETIRQAFNAARNGGEELEKFTAALRGKTTPEELVQNLRTGLDTLHSEKSSRFSDMIQTIGNETVDTTSVRANVEANLKEIGITVKDNGELDFASSKFRTVPQAQSKLQAMYNEIRHLGESQTVQSIDTSRQALKALLLTGDDASANTANYAITNAINSVREAGSQVPGYKEGLIRFGEDADFLDEISRALSSGDKATIDTAYRKLATSLKTNNEQRRNLLMELDETTNGFILSEVAGQQLSEELPRGIFRQIAAAMAGYSAFSGGLSAGLLPALVLASPRVTGEVLRALGIAAGKIDALLKAFTRVRTDLNIE